MQTEDALVCGMIDQIVESDRLVETACEYAEKVVKSTDRKVSRHLLLPRRPIPGARSQRGWQAYQTTKESLRARATNDLLKVRLLPAACGLPDDLSSC